MEYPLVTVRTAVYNTGKFVIPALESVKAQKYPNVQHIIIDDASTDNSVEVINKWIEENEYSCTFIKHEKNKGLVATVQEFNELAEGKYLTGIADDLWEDNRLFEQVRILEEAGDNCALVYSDMSEIDEDDRVLNDSFLGKKGFNLKAMPSGRVDLTTFLRKQFIPAPSVMMRMSCVREVGGYDQNLFTEDVDMWIRLILNYEIRFSSQSFVKYRRRSGSISQAKNAFIHCSHLKMWPKYFDKVDKTTRKALAHKMLGSIIRVYKFGVDKAAALKGVSFLQKQYPLNMRYRLLELFIRFNFPKRRIGLLGKSV